LVLAEPADDRVRTLPGMNNNADFPFKMFSGYLPVLGTTKSLHYLYLESQQDPIRDPVLVWFNGGPGCSSMLGFMQEHGPYVIENGETTFHWNDYSWNRETNMLYIEAPAAVGYSYCLDKTECTHFNDSNSARDNLASLLYFFDQKFPERKSNELYLSGESYAGIYVPFLAFELDKYIT
jgi:carboxypeptidase C (cathepsin A)